MADSKIPNSIKYIDVNVSTGGDGVAWLSAEYVEILKRTITVEPTTAINANSCVSKVVSGSLTYPSGLYFRMPNGGALSNRSFTVRLYYVQ